MVMQDIPDSEASAVPRDSPTIAVLSALPEAPPGMTMLAPAASESPRPSDVNGGGRKSMRMAAGNVNGKIVHTAHGDQVMPSSPTANNPNSTQNSAPHMPASPRAFYGLGGLVPREPQEFTIAPASHCCLEKDTVSLSSNGSGGLHDKRRECLPFDSRVDAYALEMGIDDWQR